MDTNHGSKSIVSLIVVVVIVVIAMAMAMVMVMVIMVIIMRIIDLPNSIDRNRFRSLSSDCNRHRPPKTVVLVFSTIGPLGYSTHPEEDTDLQP